MHIMPGSFASMSRQTFGSTSIGPSSRRRRNTTKSNACRHRYTFRNNCASFATNRLADFEPSPSPTQLVRLRCNQQIKGRISQPSVVEM